MDARGRAQKYIDRLDNSRNRQGTDEVIQTRLRLPAVAPGRGSSKWAAAISPAR
jgi:hypothetical protein